MKLTYRGVLAAGLLVAAPIASAQDVNTSQLSENGWYSDDTRADGEGTFPPGTNLISPTLTDDPEATLSGNALFDGAIADQILFGAAPSGEPAGTFKGAVRLRDRGTSSSGKSQISHRKDDGVGHFAGSALAPGFAAEYSWIGFGTTTTTASLKLGVKTADFGSTGVSSRTGENVWDKVLVYEPGQGNGNQSDGSWYTESIDWSTGNWWFFDRTTFGSTQSSPMTLEQMSTSAMLVPGGGGQTVQDVYDKIVAAGAHVTSVQFGVGSNNPGADVYVNQLVMDVYRPGQTTTFGTPSPFDQDVTPDVIFGSGNANGSWTVARSGGLELGLRSKQRFPALNVFNSNGDGSYSWNTGDASGNGDSEWNFEWTVNTDVDDTTGLTVGDYTYELGIDYDPSNATDYNAFDPITSSALVPVWDHAFGDNSTSNGGGTKFIADQPTYQGALDTFNVAQQSWRHTFFDIAPFTFDPTVPGRYDVYLAAFDNGVEVARVAIEIYASNSTTLAIEADPCQMDQDSGLPGTQVAFDLVLRNPDDVDVTGFQAFLEFDDSAMTYEGSVSAYVDGVFDAHIQPIAGAEVAPGQLRLDGNAFTGGVESGDAVVATLVFTVSDCALNMLSFDLTQAFPSEVSFVGSPLGTALLDSGDVLGDGAAPVIAPSANITAASDAGDCGQAVVVYPFPAVSDVCDLDPELVCDPPSGSVFPVGVTTVTCTATDDCGNVAVSTFDVEVTNTVLVDVTVQLEGSMPTARCIQFVPDDCGAGVSVPITFTGMAPAVGVATIELPCGVWTSLCAKDQQHTLWDTQALIDTGAKYELAAPLVLRGGDTDDDGDVDINDVTLFLAQFGDTAQAGGCPFDGVTRDADFSNDGAVGSDDYPFLVANWLETSSCACTAPSIGTRVGERVLPVRDALSKRADLNSDGQVDWRDVQEFEHRHGLGDRLSRTMRGDAR